MPSQNVRRALDLLQAAADRYSNQFPITDWRRVEGPGPDVVRLHGSGGWEGLTLEPGRDVLLECALQVPAEVEGVRIAGDPLVATLFCIYPTDVLYEGAAVFAEPGPPVASGPALFTVIPELLEGANGTLGFRLHVPTFQVSPWVQLKLTTPGLRARFEALDVAWAQLRLADALALTAEERAAVEGAAAALPEALPTGADALGAVLQALAGALTPVAARIEAETVHLVGHSHIDMNWQWTWPDTVEVVRRDFRSVLQLMDDYPELTFSHSQPATYEIIREQEPEMWERMMQHVRSGRWEPMTMTWVEGDVNMASGEGHARQLLEGVTWTREKLGVSPVAFHAPDTFGHAGNLPQLAALGGAQTYYHHRANPGQEEQWPAYWWEGQDGTRLLALSTPSYNGEILARDLASAVLRARAFNLPCGLHYHGIGDHGGGPSRQNLDALRRFQKTPLMPRAFCSTVAAYAREILQSGAPLRVHRGESSTIFEGCYTTHADTKLYNRHGENLLCTADSLAALAGIQPDGVLVPAWRAILFNQFHDILDGSAIHETYDKNRTDFEEAKAAAEQVTEEALTVLHAGAPAGSVCVTNPLGFDRTDWVEVAGSAPGAEVDAVDAGGARTRAQRTDGGVGFVATVPAFGTAVYALEPASGEAPAQVTVATAFGPTDPRSQDPLAVTTDAPYYRVENRFYRAYVRRDCGVVVSFLDKRLGRDLVAYGVRHASDYLDTARPDLALNVFQVTDEAPHGMTSWQVHEVHTERSLISGATVSILESGPARVVLGVEHKVRQSSITQRIAFYADLPRVDFDTSVDWQEIGTPAVGVPGLKAAFTASLPECEAWFETPYAAVKRPANGQEVPVLRWSDVGGPSGGFTLINDCKYGTDVLGCRTRLNLIRSAYDPDAISDKGQHRIRYAMLAHAGDWRDAGVVAEAAGFNQPLLARRAHGSGGSSAAVAAPRVLGAPTVTVGCLKAARNGKGVVVRLYEGGGRTASAVVAGIPAGAHVWEANLVEDRGAPVSTTGGAVQLSFGPWQVRTLVIEPA